MAPLSPLHAAVEADDLTRVQALVAAGADIEELGDVQENSTSRYGIRSGRITVAEYLLEQGCDVDCTDFDGNTPLHHAALNNHLEAAQLLFQWGAKLDVRNNRGRTPADIAVERRHGYHDIADAIRAEEIRRRDHGFKRDRSTIEGTEEHAASKRPREEREAEEAAAAAAAAAADESDDDDDDDDDDDEDDEQEG